MSQKGDGCDRDSAGIPSALPVHGNADAPLDSVTIFSPPAVELVFQWWRESNRRWTARNRVKAPAA
jgi:uroporphyrinogen-III synthase